MPEPEHLTSGDTVVLHPGRRICTFCEQEFVVGTRDRCPRVCDAGEHEATTIHFFKPGRLDGRCAEPNGPGLMCGYQHGEAQVHTEIPPEVAVLR